MFWPTKKLGEVLEYEQPTEYIVKSTSYRDDYKTPVLTAGKSFILGYTNEKEGIFPKEKLPVIIFDDFTTESKYVDFPFKVKSSAMKILHPRKELVDPKFIFYRMQTINFTPTQHKRYWISVYSKFEIPLPPLSEQKHIVKKIEKLFGKIDEAEKLRKEAIEDTENLLKSAMQEVFERGEKEGWPMRKLGEVCKIEKGKKPILYKKKEKDFLPYLIAESLRNDHIKYYASISDKNSIPVKENEIIIICDGSNSGDVFKGYEGILASTMGKVVHTNEIDTEYLFLFLKKNFEFLNSDKTGAATPHLNKEKFENLQIPLPPLSQQKQIVTYLDSLSEKIRQLKEPQNQTAHEISQLRQSILNKAFKGELK